MRFKIPAKIIKVSSEFNYTGERLILFFTKTEDRRFFCFLAGNYTYINE